MTEGLDLSRLAAFLGTGELSAALIQGGRSNLTFLVTDGSHEWVVRRPPLGHVLASAHDMGREHRVMSALARTAVPVPAVVAHCADPAVLGAPFYVMEKVEGTVYRTGQEAAVLGAERLAGLSAELVGVLKELHAVDPASVGLEAFGRPDGYLDRQLARWRKQLDASRSRPVEGIGELEAELVRRAPLRPGPSGIVHGDYKLDNLVIAPGGGIAAVLDWEMATLGDQLTDVGLLLAYWEQMGPGPFPSGDALAGMYGADPARLGWYRAFAYFKLAVIAEGIHFRYSAGQTLGDGFADIGARVPVLVARGRQILSEA